MKAPHRDEYPKTGFQVHEGTIMRKIRLELRELRVEMIRSSLLSMSYGCGGVTLQIRFGQNTAKYCKKKPRFGPSQDPRGAVSYH